MLIAQSHWTFSYFFQLLLSREVIPYLRYLSLLSSKNTGKCSQLLSSFLFLLRNIFNSVLPLHNTSKVVLNWLNM